MNSEILGILFVFIATVALAVPFGRYIGKVYAGEKTWLDPIFNPIEKLFFRISGIDSSKEMNWKQHLFALLAINIIWFIFGMVVLMTQGSLPLNPDHNSSMSAHLAFNTVASFISNTNLQHYSGETGLSYLSQLIAIMLFQFVSAGAGMAVCAVVFNALRERTTTQLGNFYNYFIKSCTRILFPVALVSAIFLAFNGTPMTFKGHDTLMSLQGDTMKVAMGPAAGIVAIKQAGTNGGGFFGANSAHPFENPNYFTNILENILILLIPIALVFALGYYLKRKKLAWMIFSVMTIGFLCFVIPAVYFEMHGNPEITRMGINQSLGNMEGKEVRIGSAASAYWMSSTTVTSNGSSNSDHDSAMPLSGAIAMCGMMVNCFFGGVGVGFLNFFIFIIIAVFISGLMVGRTPELLGKKIEAREMKIATIVALLHPLLILTGTAIASYTYSKTTGLNWLGNSGYHGFSEMLYEYTSSSANNGSEFTGLNGNLPFWNITDGVIMMLSRYLPIIGPIAITGLLAAKKYIPESAGTLKTDTATFGLMTYAVIIIVAALSFFPALALGPIAEFFTMGK
jgi:potassium-transporting ATPase potassium-binding subunit